MVNKVKDMIDISLLVLDFNQLDYLEVVSELFRYPSSSRLSGLSASLQAQLPRFKICISSERYGLMTFDQHQASLQQLSFDAGNTLTAATNSTDARLLDLRQTRIYVYTQLIDCLQILRNGDSNRKERTVGLGM